jgi:hypothetical protein
MDDLQQSTPGLESFTGLIIGIQRFGRHDGMEWNNDGIMMNLVGPFLQNRYLSIYRVVSSNHNEYTHSSLLSTNSVKPMIISVDADVFLPEKRKDKKMHRIRDRRTLQRSYRQPVRNPRLLKLAEKRENRKKDMRITRTRCAASLKSDEMSFRLLVQEDVDSSEVQDHQSSSIDRWFDNWSDGSDWLWWPRSRDPDYYDKIWSDIDYHDWFWSELLPSIYGK